MQYNTMQLGRLFKIVKPYIATPHVVLVEGMAGTLLDLDVPNKLLHLEFPFGNRDVLKAWVPEDNVIIYESRRTFEPAPNSLPPSQR